MVCRWYLQDRQEALHPTVQCPSFCKGRQNSKVLRCLLVAMEDPVVEWVIAHYESSIWQAIRARHTDTWVRFPLDPTDLQENTDPWTDDSVHREKGRSYLNEKTDGPSIPTTRKDQTSFPGTMRAALIKDTSTDPRTDDLRTDNVD